MTHRSAVVALLLVLFLVLVMPVWGWLEMRRLKREKTGIALARTYVTTIAAMWLISLLCARLAPPSVLWKSPIGLAGSMHLDAVPLPLIAGILIGFLAALMMPVILASFKPGSLDSQLAKIRFMLPETNAQRWLFALLCITAGVCEEWIYRGFLLHLFVTELPGANGWLIVIATAVMFGVAHTYQGRAGGVLTGLLGFVFALLYIATGNLLLSMITHAVLDLRLLLVLPRVRTATA
jgi:membrane protease YdiL (CAAX protease family)